MRGAAAEVAVVGQIHQDLGARVNKLPDQIRKRRFVGR